MSKRFFDTEMFLRPWYRSLTPRLKCLWNFMLARCDISGVMDMDWGLASFSIGDEVSDSDLLALNGNVVKLPSGKLFIPGFIPFQYGELSEASRTHIAVLKLLNEHNIGYPYSIDMVSGKQQRVHRTHKDKDKDIDKAKDKDKDKDRERWNELAEKSGLPKIDTITDGRSKKIAERIRVYPDFWEVLEKELPILQDFAKGLNPERRWKMTFDFCIQNNENFIKIKEGKYRKYDEEALDDYSHIPDENS